MQEIICLLIAFLTLSHGEFSSENDQSYRQKLYNIENGKNFNLFFDNFTKEIRTLLYKNISNN